MNCEYEKICNPTNNRCSKCGTPGNPNLKILYKMLLESQSNEKIEKSLEEVEEPWGDPRISSTGWGDDRL